MADFPENPSKNEDFLIDFPASRPPRAQPDVFIARMVEERETFFTILECDERLEDSGVGGTRREAGAASGAGKAAICANSQRRSSKSGDKSKSSFRHEK